jgi:hypothetical protein
MQCKNNTNAQSNEPVFLVEEFPTLRQELSAIHLIQNTRSRKPDGH